MEGPRHYLGNSDAVSDPRDTTARLALSQPARDALYIAKQYRTEHNGVTHIIYRQRFQGADVLNAEWVVNVDRDGRVLNSGGTLVSAAPVRTLPDPARSLTAVRSAVRAVNPQLADFLVMESAAMPRGTNTVRFDRGPLPLDVEGKRVWYAVNGDLRPAWNFFVAHTDRIHRYSVTVDDGTQEILKQQAFTFSQSASGMVFERESPQPVTSPGLPVTGPPALVSRTMQSFQGDPVASPNTWTDGTATGGNNVMVGENLPGSDFIVPTPTASQGGIFNFPLNLGPGYNPLDYRDAANTNLFYWLNMAHDLHYKYGFDEAAGNYQADNFGRGGVGGDRINAYTHYGAQALTSGDVENSFFSLQGSDDDGVQAEVSMFLSVAPGPAGDFFTDGSYDAQVMIHEYTHGVSSRLARGAYSVFQGGAMGEAWSDFYGIEYSLANGAPPDGVYPVAQYFNQSWGTGIRTRPYSTNTDINPLTYANLGHVIYLPEVHADGEIWVECLWEVRANLIAQFGEDEGRKRVRQLVLDGMKLSVPASTMVDMRDAILLADRVDYNGASQSQIWTAFAKRGMGALAYSDGAATTHVHPSFDMPSTTGAIAFYDSPLVAGEPVRILFQNSSYTQPTAAIQLTTPSGDAETVILEQHGSLYVGSMATRLALVAKHDLAVEIVPNDQITASWTSGTSNVQATLPTMLSYTNSITPSNFSATHPAETRYTGTSARLTLPFSFPYFDKHYETVIAYRNGLVSFDTPVTTSSCTDATALRKYIGFAPLWLPLSVTGSAQPNEGMYVSTSSDGTAMTIRWAAEYAAIGQNAVPVNFAVTIFDDGAFTYSYGTGNQIQAATGSVCGVPATGFSNGHDTYSSTFLFTNYQNAGNATFFPPFGAILAPTATVTSPQPGQHVQDLLTVAGTASDPATFIRSIDVFIDGVQRSRVLPAGGGWSVALNLASLGIQPGDHTLQVRVTNANAATIDYPNPALTFTMDPGQAGAPVIVIEKPADGANVTGLLAVSGYAYEAGMRVSSVDTLIDGVTRAITNYGISRTDICGPLNPAPPNCPGIGFSGSFSTVESNVPIPNGPHTVQVRVRDNNGRLFLYPATPLTVNVNNPTNANIVGVIETPAANATLSGVISISGYLYSPGHRIILASLIVDDVVYNSVALKINQPRPDLCPNLPDADACPNIGFTATFDTNRLLNGPHVLGIEAINDLGDYVIFPAQVSQGINIFTQN